MRRTATFRIGAALAAVVFAVTSGITAMEVHQLGAHRGPPPVSLTTPPAPVASAALTHHDAHAGHGAIHRSHTDAAHAAEHTGAAHDPGHSGHSEHGSSECTCVGPCASGAPPTLVEPTFAELVLGEPEPTRLVPVPVDAVHQDPRSYLLPFSNAPPTRV